VAAATQPQEDIRADELPIDEPFGLGKGAEKGAPALAGATAAASALLCSAPCLLSAVPAVGWLIKSAMKTTHESQTLVVQCKT
jgi:hypothetical protein